MKCNCCHQDKVSVSYRSWCKSWLCLKCWQLLLAELSKLQGDIIQEYHFTYNPFKRSS